MAPWCWTCATSDLYGTPFMTTVLNPATCLMALALLLGGTGAHGLTAWSRTPPW